MASIAATPDYVPVVSDIAPGHRFLTYFQFWSAADFSANRREMTQALKGVCTFGESAKNQVKALRERQATHMKNQGLKGHTIAAISTAPFATGLGNEHPIENGFSFLTPYGLPYLAGSGVKGILRRAMRELRDDSKDGFTDEAIDALFGPEDINQPEDAKRGALDFWDVFPSPAGDKLVVEIMTPHFGEYYRGNQTPHDSGAPVPVSFLAVPAKSKFDFHMVCHSGRLPESLQSTWREMLDNAFKHAFDWVGFGAKTSVGYGAMQQDPEEKKRRDAAQKLTQDAETHAQQKASRALALSSMSESKRAIAEYLDERVDKNQPEWSALIGGLKKGTWNGDVLCEIAEHIKQLMVNAKKWKEKTEKKNPEKDGDYQDTLVVMKYL